LCSLLINFARAENHQVGTGDRLSLTLLAVKAYTKIGTCLHHVVNAHVLRMLCFQWIAYAAHAVLFIDLLYTGKDEGAFGTVILWT